MAHKLWDRAQKLWDRAQKLWDLTTTMDDGPLDHYLNAQHLTPQVAKPDDRESQNLDSFLLGEAVTTLDEAVELVRRNVPVRYTPEHIRTYIWTTLARMRLAPVGSTQDVAGLDHYLHDHVSAPGHVL